MVSRAPSSTKDAESWHSGTCMQLFRSVQSDPFNQAQTSPRAPMPGVTNPPALGLESLSQNPRGFFPGSWMNRPNPRHCITGCGTKLRGASTSFLRLQRKTLNRKLWEVRCMVLWGAVFTPPAHLLDPSSAASHNATVCTHKGIIFLLPIK